MFLHTAVAWAFRLAGWLLVYAAAFLYEDEEGHVQNVLEKWWIEISEKRMAALSASTATLSTVAKVAGRGFDHIFGNRLISFRSFAEALAWELA